MIAIIDYGIGNLRSVEKALHFVGASAILTSDSEQVRQASGVILPGVGAFGACASGLENAGFVPIVKELAALGRPLLGICVGMQLLFDDSEEMGYHSGLGLLPGSVRRFNDDFEGPDGHILKVPQIGWNQLWHNDTDALLKGVASGSYAYFVHSYYCDPRDSSAIIARTDYGIDYASVVRKPAGDVWGVQFHPEKSHDVGLQILRNFVDIVEIGESTGDGN
ncbi:MAG: imidazole glycerol phosphate synthase subunit HisH [Chloroflexota bacterium]|nr:imidazole glycerol phosphate synthase subunit HisH [Chloroflexota bacterium]